MEDLGIPKSLMDDAESMFQTGFQLTVPPDAEAKRNKGYARWPELFTVEKAYREVKETEGGATHVVFAVKGQIMPVGDTKNGGRSFTAWNRCNYAAMAAVENALKSGNQEAIDAAKDDGQYKMSRGAVKKLKQIAVVAGVDLTQTDLTGPLLQALFPLKDVEENVSSLDGQTFKVSMLDNANRQWQEKNQQEIDAWAPNKVVVEGAA